MGIGLNELLVLFAVVLVAVAVAGLGTGTWLRLRRTLPRPIIRARVPPSTAVDYPGDELHRRDSSKGEMVLDDVESGE